jgi:RNA polymerase sigma-70 factor (ECF subfamily)
VTDVTPPHAVRYYAVSRESELALIERVRTGDRDAFDALYGTYNARLFGFLIRLARSRDVAEDLLEETWLRFVSHASRLNPDTRLGPWLFTVARNLHLSYCRSRAFEESGAGCHVGLWPTPRQASPFEYTAGSELERRIEAALATLPVTSREVLLLVGVEGMRPSEAAAVCGISPETFRQRLKRARDLLASRIEPAKVRV